MGVFVIQPSLQSPVTHFQPPEQCWVRSSHSPPARERKSGVSLTISPLPALDRNAPRGSPWLALRKRLLSWPRSHFVGNNCRGYHFSNFEGTTCVTVVTHSRWPKHPQHKVKGVWANENALADGGADWSPKVVPFLAATHTRPTSSRGSSSALSLDISAACTSSASCMRRSRSPIHPPTLASILRKNTRWQTK